MQFRNGWHAPAGPFMRMIRMTSGTLLPGRPHAAASCLILAALVAAQRLPQVAARIRRRISKPSAAARRCSARWRIHSLIVSCASADTRKTPNRAHVPARPAIPKASAGS